MPLDIRKVSKDRLPKSNVPGKQRQPSDFDEYMAEAFEDREWRGVPYDGTEETLAKLTAELGRAVTHFDASLPDGSVGAGKSVRDGIDEDTGEPTFYFQIRDKLKTGRRKKDAVGNEIPGTEEDEDEPGEGVEVEGVATSAEENDAQIATSISDAKFRKRARGGNRDTDPVTANFSNA